MSESLKNQEFKIFFLMLVGKTEKCLGEEYKINLDLAEYAEKSRFD